jgi:hypothetical protein
MAETSEQIERLLNGIERDYQEKVSAIDKQIADAKASGFRFSRAEEDKLLEQRQIHQNTFGASVERIQARLIEAKAREQAELQAQQANQAKQAASITINMKAKALKEWTNSGGLPGEFESAWPAIRSQMLQAQAIRSMAQAPASNIRL